MVHGDERMVFESDNADYNNQTIVYRDFIIPKRPNEKKSIVPTTFSYMDLKSMMDGGKGNHVGVNAWSRFSTLMKSVIRPSI